MVGREKKILRCFTCRDARSYAAGFRVGRANVPHSSYPDLAGDFDGKSRSGGAVRGSFGAASPGVVYDGRSLP